MDLLTIAATYENTCAWHDATHNNFIAEVRSRPYLMQHKTYADHIIYGEISFHYLWDLLVQACPDNFRFLEIGVFKGQVTSLIGLLAKQYFKRAFVVGVSLFDGTGDKYSNYPRNVDYEAVARNTWFDFCPSGSDIALHLIKGSSTDFKVLSDVSVTAPYDIVYIDGCHDYEYVVQDLHNYKPLVCPGGYLVMDDAATDRNTNQWPGHADVGRAVNEYLDTDSRFKFLLSVGHIKLYRKLK
jgi:hypothetical protein